MRAPPFLGQTLLWAALVCAAAARAGAAPAATDDASRLESQAASVRADLDAANAAVAALKRAGRSVSGDYRLRQKMADAEALARKLTDTEAELRRLRGVAPDRRPNLLVPTPDAEPQDGPVELVAKADLMSDQARRMVAEAESLARAADQIRTRQTLRRRAGQIERDPFAGLDASKRSMVFAAPGKKAPDNLVAGGNKTVSPTPDTSGAARGSSELAPPQSTAPTVATAPAPATGTGGTAQPPPTPGSGTGSTPTASDSASPAAAGNTNSPTGPTSTTGAEGAPSTVGVSLHLRTLLDQATLAEINRLGAAGKPLSGAEALEKAAAALRARAQGLEAQAKALRGRAKP